MYIEPGTNIRLLKDVPLDTTYDHTIYFGSASAQTNFFISKQKYNLTNYTYQRVNKGVARVGINAENLYDCNYMMFQNASFGNKWFYAFITAVEYLNNSASSITFEIDVMQTWFFDCSPDYCFVEREHTFSDVIGEHIEPEPVSVGEYVMNTYGNVTPMSDMCVIIAIVDVDEETTGTLYDGIYGAADLWCYNASDTVNINSKVNEYTQNYDNIIGIYTCPKILIGDVSTGGKHLQFGSSGVKTTITLDTATSTTLDGYTPKNNKLYTYPYNFYHIDNANGSELSLRYEFFSGDNVKVEIGGSITQPVQCVLRPVGYKGSSSNQTYNCETLTLANYPICSWNVDSYQAWVAQNGVITAGSGIASIVTGGLLSLATANPAPLIMSTIGAVGNTLTQDYTASIQADISKGSFNNGSANVALGTQAFYGGHCSITQYNARIIDDFFNMYGYAVRRCKVPNRSSRPAWNYVKTIGATVTGSVPADDMKKICSIYDNGVTFWKDGNQVGNYLQDNKP